MDAIRRVVDAVADCAAAGTPSIAPPRAVLLNGVAPTFIRSDRIKPHLARPAFRDFILERNPLGRIGDPAEVAGPVVALVADAGSDVTGQVLYVDGGVTASQ